MIQKFVLVVFSLFLLIKLSPVACDANEEGTFLQEIRTFYTSENGLPSNQVRALTINMQNKVFAGTDAGLYDGAVAK